MSMTAPVRAIRIEGDVAYVPLTKGYEAVIDAADVPKVSRWNWCARVQSNTVYAIRTHKVQGVQSTMLMHRLLMQGGIDGLEVDHIDGNGLNNRQENLRPATRSENLRNTRISRRSTTGCKGVMVHKKSGRFRAQIQINGVVRHLGYFSTKEAAAAAYAEASAQLHGSFGRVA